MSSKLDHAEQQALIWTRIGAGDRIRMYYDYYGAHWIELTPCWQFWRKRRFRLTPSEMAEIRSLLSPQRRAGAQRQGGKVVAKKVVA
ncbi:MAG: hypothetical protein R3D51_08935 [Hyphomicrobiaceae bacterium]